MKEQLLVSFVSKYKQNWSAFEEIMASKVRVPPSKVRNQKKKLCMLKLITVESCLALCASVFSSPV